MYMRYIHVQGQTEEYISLTGIYPLPLTMQVLIKQFHYYR